MKRKTLPPGISSTGEKIRFALGDVGFNVMWGFVGGYLTYYYTDSVLVSASVVGTIMMLARLLDGASDILMGIIIDKTSTKMGKARPWILWSLVPLLISFLLVFHVPASLSDTGKLVYIAVTYVFMSAVTYTAANMAYITLFTLFAPDSNDRNFAAVFRTLFAMITSLVIGMISLPMLKSFGGVTSQAAWTKLCLIYAAFSTVCVLITIFGVKEKKLGNTAESGTEEKKDTKSLMKVFKQLAKSKYFYLAAFLSVAYYLSNSTGGANVFYARDILGDENLVGIIGLVSLPPMVFAAVLAPALYKKFGKRNIMMVGSVIALAAAIVQLMNPYHLTLFLAFYALKGFGSMLFGAAISTLPGDVADWSEWKTGERAEGIVTSLASFGAKVGSGVGAGLVGWILALGNYDGAAAVQAQSALNSEIALMIGVPMVLAVIQILLLLFWNMEKIRPALLKDLEDRRKAS